MKNKMNIEDAAKKLYDELQDTGKGYKEPPDWLASIGTDTKDIIFLYTKKKKHPKQPKTYEGFKVKVVYTGTPKPATI